MFATGMQLSGVILYKLPDEIIANTKTRGHGGAQNGEQSDGHFVAWLIRKGKQKSKWVVSECAWLTDRWLTPHQHQHLLRFPRQRDRHCSAHKWGKNTVNGSTPLRRGRTAPLRHSPPNWWYTGGQRCDSFSLVKPSLPVHTCESCPPHQRTDSPSSFGFVSAGACGQWARHSEICHSIRQGILHRLSVQRVHF